MNKQWTIKAQELKNIYGKISPVMLMRKLNISFAKAKEIISKLL